MADHWDDAYDQARQIADLLSEVELLPAAERSEKVLALLAHYAELGDTLTAARRATWREMNTAVPPWTTVAIAEKYGVTHQYVSKELRRED